MKIIITALLFNLYISVTPQPKGNNLDFYIQAFEECMMWEDPISFVDELAFYASEDEEDAKTPDIHKPPPSTLSERPNDKHHHTLYDYSHLVAFVHPSYSGIPPPVENV